MGVSLINTMVILLSSFSDISISSILVIHPEVYLNDFLEYSNIIYCEFINMIDF